MKRQLQFFILALVLSVTGLAVLTSSVFAAGGTGPGDALIPTGATQTIGGLAQMWFRFTYTGDRSLITASLASNDAGDLAFFVHTPEEIQDWQNGDDLISIGQGTANIEYDLVWTGRFTQKGTYYVVVKNYSDATRSFKLNVSGDSVTTTANVRPTATPLPNPFATTIPIGSVSGGRILFQQSSGGSIMTVNPDGSDLRVVTFGIDPVWSPDRTRIAFARQGTPSGLYVINADGSNEQLVYGANDVRSPTWSPDGSQIVFATITNVKSGQTFCFRGQCVTGEDTVTWKLRKVELSDNSASDVFTPPEGALSPTFNKDGNTVAFMGPSLGLMVTGADNSFDPYIIAGDLQFNSPRFNPLLITSPTYSPDGKQLAFMVMQNPAWQIAVANADGSNIRLLTRIDPFDFNNPRNVAPTWSPDGSQILFLSNRNNGKWEFFAINTDGSNLRQVLKNITDVIPLTYNYSLERMLSWR